MESRFSRQSLYSASGSCFHRRPHDLSLCVCGPECKRISPRTLPHFGRPKQHSFTMHPSRLFNPTAQNYTTNHRVVSQPPATDRGYGRRNALDHRTPPELRAMQVTPQLPPNFRRNGADFGVPEMLVPPVGSRMQHGVMRRGSPQLPDLPAEHMPLRGVDPLPALRPEAPSLQREHPYAVMRLAKLGSGNNYRPPPPSTHCPECRMDDFIAHQRQKFSDQCYPPVVPAGEFGGLGTAITFQIEGHPTVPGVFLHHILRFKADIAQGGQTLIRTNGEGPMTIVFHIEGVGMVKDIIYANCPHRAITRFNLAYALASGFYCLGKQVSDGAYKDLTLVSLEYDKYLTQWVALARFVHH
ncbi:hypothetical protein B0H12DRAFT_1141217 [Mycena haematopus]|nr:hypothetical protein B0H12DRAFT_1141217 [Mycena haematopus]